MKLPNHEKALVEKQKLVAYLLSDENSGGKSEFFKGLGFSEDNWETMRDAFLKHAADNEITNTMPNPHGVKYIIEGQMDIPDDKKAFVRTIWIVEHEQEIPRLVSAYPAKEKKS